MEEWGYLDLILRSDQEPAIASICEAVKKRRTHRTILEKSPR